MVPLVYSTSATMTLPFSTVLVMSKTASAMAQEMKTEASARCSPRTGCLSAWTLQVGDWLTRAYPIDDV